jgi:hypothetical protein
VVAAVVAVAVTAATAWLAAVPSSGAVETSQNRANWTPAEAQKLVGLIPEDYRYQCELLKESDLGTIVAPHIDTMTASVRCTGVPALRALRYYTFDSVDSMDALFDDFVRGPNDGPYRDENAQCPGTTTWGFGDRDDGRLACYYAGADADGAAHPESVVLIWTYAPANFVGLVETEYGDNDASALKQWWNDSAAPQSADGESSPVGFVDWTRRDKKAEQSLLSHVPTAIRQHCLVGDRASATAPFSSDRHWARAVVRCQSGDVNAAYLALDPKITDQYFAAYNLNTEPGDPCPARGTWSEGEGAKRHEAGEYVCFSAPQGDRTVYRVVWSHRKLGIVGSGVLYDKGFEPLMNWWNGDVGPT